MVILSSLSPKHSNCENQQEAVRSWQKIGDVYSLNSAKEISLIEKDYFGVNFIETHRTVEGIFGKPCVSVNSLIDFAIENNSDALLVNSDIIITELPPLRMDGITFFSRYDYSEHFGDAKIFQAGFDLYFIPKTFLKIFPPSIYALGVAWWDYWVVMVCIKNNIPVYWPQGKYAYHKLHKTQYSVEEWLYVGEFFKWQFKANPQFNIGQLATNYLNIIKTKAIKTV